MMPAFFFLPLLFNNINNANYTLDNISLLRIQIKKGK